VAQGARGVLPALQQEDIADGSRGRRLVGLCSLPQLHREGVMDTLEADIGPFLVFESRSGSWLVHHKASRENMIASATAPEACAIAAFLATMTDVPWAKFTRPSMGKAFWSRNEELFDRMERGVARIQNLFATEVPA
jgi:hypothetical protein